MVTHEAASYAVEVTELRVARNILREQGTAGKGGEYAHLLEIDGYCQRAANRVTQAVEEVSSYLQAHVRCVGMVLETQEGVARAAATLWRRGSHRFRRYPPFLIRWFTPIWSFLMIASRAGVCHFCVRSSGPRRTSSLLHAVAQQLGMRVANDQMRQQADRAEASASRRIREVAALYEIGHVPSGDSVQPLLQLIVDRTALLMEAQACSIMLFDAEQQCFATGGQSRFVAPRRRKFRS